VSYILDALRKLEQNRLHEEALTFLAFQGQKPAKPRRRRLWAYLLIAALFANAGALVWWLGFQSPSPAPFPASTQALSGTRPADPAAPDPSAEKGETRALERDSLPRPVAEPSQAAGQGMKAAQPTVKPAPAVQKTAASGRAPSEKQSQDPQSTPMAPKPALSREPGPRPGTLAKPLPAAKPPLADRGSPMPGQASISLQNSIAKPDPATPEKPSPGLQVREATPPADGRVLRPGDLPPDVAARLPKMKVSLHYYIADLQSRFVLINDRLLREEEYLSEGLKVEQINPGDVVMNYRGWRFQIGLEEGR
jgi:hypothetical protein